MIFAFPSGHFILIIDFYYMKKIAILGSTGSIGKNTLKIIEKDKQNFEIVLLSTNKNTKLILEQAKEFNVKKYYLQKNFH